MGFSHINPGGATGYNMAISYLIQNSIRGTYPDFEIDYLSVVLCTKGKLSAPETVTMELNGMILKLNWSTDSSIKSHSNDEVQILIYQPGGKSIRYLPRELSVATEELKSSWIHGIKAIPYTFICI